MLNRGGPISKIISGTIGLAKEYKADSKERKAAAEAAENQASSSGSGSAPETYPRTAQNGKQSSGDGRYDDDSTDDEEWLLDLDEAQQELENSTYSTQDSSKGNFDEHRMLQTFAQRHPPPPGGTSSLPSLVLLPQRRPKSQHKGFVRAYAPVLEQCGIDQDTWLEFLDGFEKSISKSSWFHVTNAGIMVAGNAAALTLGISPILHLVSTAVHVSVEASRRGYLNYQQNGYLDVMNQQFFTPRGLYCMVIKYEPSSSDIVQNVDLDRNISQSIGGRQDQSKWRSIFKNSSMKIENDLEIPAIAPLVFPGLDDLSEKSTSSSLKHFGHVIQDYQNRRAAAKFEAENPNSHMPAAPRKEFASVYGDPNSTVNSGDLISLASKGTKTSLGPSGGLSERIRERREGVRARRKQKKEKRPLHKLMRAHALYLMVTNLPSQEVLDRVAAQMENEESR